MPARSKGRLLSGDGGDHIAVCLQHEHSGWKVVLDVLTDYVTRWRMYAGTVDLYQDVAFGHTGPGSVPLTLRLEDVGMEIDDGGDEALATDALDLIRSVIQETRRWRKSHWGLSRAVVTPTILRTISPLTLSISPQ